MVSRDKYNCSLCHLFFMFFVNIIILFNYHLAVDVKIPREFLVQFENVIIFVKVAILLRSHTYKNVYIHITLRYSVANIMLLILCIHT